MTAPLTPRQRQIAAMLALPNKQIARRLGIEPPTVRAHVSAILLKTGTRTRTEAALKLTGVTA